MTTITNLSTEYRRNPLGIDIRTPRLGWQMVTERAGARQTAYRIFAASSAANLREGAADVWDSGKVESDQSIHVAYAEKPLVSRQRVYWSVTVWDETGKAAHSEPAWFELGLLRNADWKAKWIGASLQGGPRSMIPAPYLRKPFSLGAKPRSARLYFTAMGLPVCSINGQPVSEDVLTPGWTEYGSHVQYNVYEVTSLLRQGENAMGIILGDGWAVGHTGWQHRQLYAARPHVLAQLEITGEDGSVTTVITDRTWRYQFGAITHNDLLQGEAYDARLEFPAWDSAAFDDRRWFRAEVFPLPKAAIVATNGPTVRRIQELKPISDPVDKGSADSPRAVFDLGQNMVGRVRFKGSAPRGTTITLRFAEVLNPDGSLYTTNFRSAKVTDYYTFKGEGEEVWEPHFTFHGFRYVELLGYKGKVTRDTITGVVLHSEMEPTGTFECSDPLLNQLQHNIQWGQKGNFVDVPTDCPQRDERLGWTGDIQVFIRTAAYNFDVAGFMTKWAKDVADAQTKVGSVPAVVPAEDGAPDDGGPAWADAAVICPWTIYLCYGDSRILEENYGVMTRFMDFMLKGSPDYIRCAPNYEGWPGFGDWLSINADTPRDLIGTAFLAYDATLMAQIATILGKANDASKYRSLFEKVKTAFGKRFLTGSKITKESDVPSEIRKRVEQMDRLSRGFLSQVDYGQIKTKVFNAKLFTPHQTAYVLALHFDLLPDKLRPLAADELVADIERRGMHLSTGFVGAPYLPHVLSGNGKLDAAYALLNQKTWPSWLFAVTQGATTIWERWDGWTEEHGFQNPEMNSFNHYAYGSIGAWMYNTIAGIEVDLAQPGYKHSIIRPQPGGGLTHASGKLKTLYGTLESSWEFKQGKFKLRVVVPPNTSATVQLPIKDGAKLTLNGKAATGTVHDLPAGTYEFAEQ
ncbi:MAG: family 78 glycoside hydrolase catalytic domain [Anaerolineae bacterium]|nr:family 78 glycoside hydrolase catalytic domain [Anaerolineae bacterium]